jgi:hypothetical protein
MESRWSKRLVLARSPVGLQLLTRAAAVHPTICKAWADSAYRTAVIEHGATLSIDVEVVRRDPATRGFAALPRRWAVERTLAARIVDGRPEGGYTDNFELICCRCGDDPDGVTARSQPSFRQSAGPTCVRRALRHIKHVRRHPQSAGTTNPARRPMLVERR